MSVDSQEQGDNMQSKLIIVHTAHVGHRNLRLDQLREKVFWPGGRCDTRMHMHMAEGDAGAWAGIRWKVYREYQLGLRPN